MLEANILRVYPGANIYGSKPTLVAQLNLLRGGRTSCYQYKNTCADLIRNINLLQPSHTKEWEDDIPVFIRPADNLDVAECIAYLAVLLQRWSGYPVGEYSCQPVNASFDDGASLICIEYSQISPAVAALTTSIRVFQKLIQHPDEVGNLFGIQFFRLFIDQYVSKPAAQTKFIREARKRNIPWRNLGETDEYLELGHGRKRQRVHRQFSMKTSYIATQASTYKSITNQLLRSRGLPVPHQFVIENEKQAIDAFYRLGAPVVVKPLATDYGTAVHPNLMSVNEVLEAFHVAKRYRNVLMESHIAGDQHRIMIINGKLTSVRKQVPAHVIGNGVDNIIKLVNEANLLRKTNGWALIPVDEESQVLLKRQHFFWESVPLQNQRVNLRLQGNLSTGGTMEVVTDIVHSDNVLMAKRAAAILDIDIAGIDFITTDISKPYYESGGQICEINVSPGFIFNEEKILFDEWFPNQDNGRVPVMVFLDIKRGSYLNGCLVDSLLSYSCLNCCIVNDRGVFLGNNRLCDKTLSMNNKIQLALSEPGVDATVIFLESKDVIAEGVCLEYIDYLSICESEDCMQDNAEKIGAISVLSALSQNMNYFASCRSPNIYKAQGLKRVVSEGGTNEMAMCIASTQKITSMDDDLLRRVFAFVASI